MFLCPLLPVCPFLLLSTACTNQRDVSLSFLSVLMVIDAVIHQNKVVEMWTIGRTKIDERAGTKNKPILNFPPGYTATRLVDLL